MFKDAFQKLELAEIATILDTVNPLFEGSVFDPLEATVMAVKLPFYQGFKFLDIADHSTMPPLQRYVIYGPEKAIVIDFTNAPLYRLNKEAPLKLTDKNVAEYVRFFFDYVRGRHGRFLITEGVDDIRWRDEPPPAARKAVGKMLIPVTLKNKKGGVYNLEATMMFKNSLLKSDMEVGPDGVVTLKNEELLVEDIPVLDDTFGQ